MILVAMTWRDAHLYVLVNYVFGARNSKKNTILASNVQKTMPAYDLTVHKIFRLSLKKH